MADGKGTCPFAANEKGKWNCGEGCALYLTDYYIKRYFEEYAVLPNCCGFLAAIIELSNSKKELSNIEDRLSKIEISIDEK